jgi:hypothetical protein
MPICRHVASRLNKPKSVLAISRPFISLTYNDNRDGCTNAVERCTRVGNSGALLQHVQCIFVEIISINEKQELSNGHHQSSSRFWAYRYRLLALTMSSREHNYTRSKDNIPVASVDSESFLRGLLHFGATGGRYPSFRPFKLGRPHCGSE